MGTLQRQRWLIGHIYMKRSERLTVAEHSTKLEANSFVTAYWPAMIANVLHRSISA